MSLRKFGRGLSGQQYGINLPEAQIRSDQNVPAGRHPQNARDGKSQTHKIWIWGHPQKMTTRPRGTERASVPSTQLWADSFSKRSLLDPKRAESPVCPPSSRAQVPPKFKRCKPAPKWADRSEAPLFHWEGIKSRDVSKAAPLAEKMQCHVGCLSFTLV